MNQRAKLISLAEETLSILSAGRYTIEDGMAIEIAKSLNNCVTGTRLFGPDQLLSIRTKVLSAPCTYHSTLIEFENETSLAGAFHLYRASQGGRVGVLNFASARHPGGGFRNGSEAQEESLARSSGLYKSLLQGQEYYSYHRASSSLLYSHRIIYSPACPVFRNDEGDLIAVPYEVDFLTCPAPNAGAIRRNQPESTDMIISILRERITFILALALSLGVVDLVLGAWGCGVFQNDPASVAEAFRDALLKDDQFYGRFRKVRFSILSRSRIRSRDITTLQTFAEAFRTDSPK